MKCSEIREMLPAYGDPGGATLAVRRHLARCPECRTEFARYDTLQDNLRDLAVSTVDVPHDLMRDLVAIPNSSNPIDNVVTHVTRNRGAYLGGVAVAVAGAAGAALWQRRRHRLVTA
jgi:anti-sigma factor RsiW